MQRRSSPRDLSRGLALASAIALMLGSFATARAGEVCEVPSSGPVSLVILSSGPKVLAYARDLKGVVIRRDAETVIFNDGRVITADVEAATRHLNAVGWGSRSINVVATFAPARARPRRG